VSFDEDLSEKNVKEPMSEDQTEPVTAFIDVDELNALSQLRENSEQNTVTDSENVTSTRMDDLSSPVPILDEQYEKVSTPSENTEKIYTPTPQNSLYKMNILQDFNLCEDFNLNGTRSIRGLVMKWIRMHARVLPA
jgi:hypothetical protein